MIKYKEESAYHKGPMIVFALTVIGLIAWLAYAVNGYLAGAYSPMDFGYIIFFVCIMLWRYGCKYTYTITDKELIAERFGFGFHSVKTIPFIDIELFSNKYKRKPFMHVREKGYWYSSGDERRERIIVYFVGAKRKGLLIRVSDEFIAHLREVKSLDYYEL